MKASKQLFKIAEIIKKLYFNPLLEYNWKKYKSIGDIRNVYPIEKDMLNKYRDNEVFQNAYEKGFLFFDKNGKLEKIHSKETFEKDIQPEKCSQDDVLVIGRFNDCYPISRETFNERYKHLEGTQYLKKSNIIIEAIKNPYDYEIIVQNEHGDLHCNVGDYIIKNGNSYAVVNKEIFQKTYQETE